MKRSRLVAYGMLGMLTAATAAFSPQADEVELFWWSVDAGGGRLAGGDLTLVSTLGQADAGRMSGGPFALNGGFLAFTPIPCDGDTNGDATVDVDDLLNVILDWGTDGSENGGDVTGNGDVDVDDLVAVIMTWGICE